ncbi:hypothetical protein B0J12DRAFT_770012 [Macrophomina phaseolina]|uniref:Uncharacterized protein n=1 Tax=Macrophomina phaseolina TaxID=35725 RepID=A0ABQ8GLY8_9PEZI|nr:hypothetical protein B0J12DRAFT_770012 [Macrophomina phaseolina]
MKSLVLLLCSGAIASVAWSPIRDTFTAGATTQNCPLSRPAVPARHLKNQLDAAVKPGAALSLNITVNGNWFSAGVFSTADVKGSNDGTLFDFHYRPPGQENAMLGAKVDRNSVYRIGSTSNLLTIYALLAERGDVDWKLPITDE